MCWGRNVCFLYFHSLFNGNLLSWHKTSTYLWKLAFFLYCYRTNINKMFFFCVHLTWKSIRVIFGTIKHILHSQVCHVYLQLLRLFKNRMKFKIQDDIWHSTIFYAMTQTKPKVFDMYLFKYSIFLYSFQHFDNIKKKMQFIPKMF